MTIYRRLHEIQDEVLTGELPTLTKDPTHMLLEKVEALADELRRSQQASSDRFGTDADRREAARRLYTARRTIDTIFEYHGFCVSPAWDIMLDLYLAETELKPVSVSSACIGAACPPTTALRWLQVLENRGLIERCGDPGDKRRTVISLTPLGRSKTIEALDLHLRE